MAISTPDQPTPDQPTLPAAPSSAGGGASGIVSLVVVAGLCSLCGPPGAGPFPGGGEAGSPWERAQEALARRDFAEARGHLRAVLAQCPLNAEAQFVTARTCRRAGDFAGWETHLRKAEILGWPAPAVDLEAMLRRAQAGDVWEVEGPLRTYLNQFPPEEGLILEALGLGYLEAKRLNDVLGLTGAWSRRFPDDWMPYLLRGRALQFAPEKDEAVPALEEVLARRPDHAEARLWLAQILLQFKRFDEALGHYERYLATRPGDADGLFGLACCQAGLGKPEASLATLGKLRPGDRDHAGVYLLRGKLALGEGRAGDALDWLRRAAAAAPGDREVLYQLVQALRQACRHQEIGRYEALLQEATGREEEWAALVRQIRSRPSDATLRYQAGLLCLRRGREADAVVWFGTALALDPYHAPTHRALADYYQAQGNESRASYHRRRAESKVTGS